MTWEQISAEGDRRAALAERAHHAGRYVEFQVQWLALMACAAAFKTAIGQPPRDILVPDRPADSR